MNSKPPRDLVPWIYWGLFFTVIPLVALWLATRPAPIFSTPVLSVPVLKQDLPAYHAITAGNVTNKIVDARLVVKDSVREARSLIGNYTRDALAADTPILKDQLFTIPDPRLISDTLSAAIPISSTTILGGELSAGDVVSMTVVPISDTTRAPLPLFDQVLVLDVKMSDNDTVVVLAIPASQLIEYLDKTRNARIVLARRIK